MNIEVQRRPEAVLLSVESKGRGFKSPLAFRRWCQRHGVPIHQTGRLAFVHPTEVDRAVSTIPAAPPPAGTPRSLVKSATDTIISNLRRRH